jgi:hypothetical protein
MPYPQITPAELDLLFAIEFGPAAVANLPQAPLEEASVDEVLATDLDFIEDPAEIADPEVEVEDPKVIEMETEAEVEVVLAEDQPAADSWPQTVIPASPADLSGYTVDMLFTPESG